MNAAPTLFRWSGKAMGAKVFQQSKSDVLEYCQGLVERREVAA